MAEGRKIKIYPRDLDLGEFIEVPMGPGKRQEPVIKGKGPSVWAVASYAIKGGMTAEEISAMWKGEITPEEVQAAIDFWKKYPELIEDKNPPDQPVMAERVDDKKGPVAEVRKIKIYPRDYEMGEFIEFPMGPGKRQEPVINGKGTPIWVLVTDAVKWGMTPEEISAEWKGYITPEEVRAAVEFWKKYPETVEDKNPAD